MRRGELDESAGCRRLGGGGGVVAARARLCRFPVWRLAGGVYIAHVRWVLGGPSLRAGLDVASGDICANRHLKRN